MRKVPKKKSKSWTSSEDSDSSSSSADEYRRESKLMRLKAYDNLKVPGLPKSAAELRTWKNGVISQLVACCGSSERELLAWLAKPFEGEEILPSDEFPVLNRVIGSKILDTAKGILSRISPGVSDYGRTLKWTAALKAMVQKVPTVDPHLESTTSRFSIDFQTLQERSVRSGVQVQGHMLIAKICKKFRLDKQSQQHLLALKPQGNQIKDLEVFRDRVEFVLSGLETSDYPAESFLRTWIYDCFKYLPHEYREASVGSHQRSFQFLQQSMIEIIDEAQYDQNASSIQGQSSCCSRANQCSRQEKEWQEREKGNLWSRVKGSRKEGFWYEMCLV